MQYQILEQSQFLCPVCLVQFTVKQANSPMMVCINQHNLCYSCLNKLHIQKCPLCKQSINMPKVSKNRYLMEHIKQKQQKQIFRQFLKIQGQARHPRTKQSFYYKRYQTCPMCKVLIQYEDSGHWHVSCPNCKCIFCFLCLAVYSTGKLKAESWEAVGCKSPPQICILKTQRQSRLLKNI